MIRKLKTSPWLNLILPFLVVNLFSIFGLFVFFPRSIFYYEYAVVLLALWFFKKPWPSILLFILIFIVDVFTLFSSLFLFQLNEFIASIQFANLYKFNFSQILLVLLGVAYAWFIIKVLSNAQKNIHQNTKRFLYTFLIIYGTIFVVDITTGNSIFYSIENEERERHREKDHKNLASSLFYDQYKELSKVSNNEPVVLKDSSITFSAFVKDTIGNQMTIVVESWGVIADNTIQKKLEQSLIRVFNKEGYSVTTGLSKYYGSTTAAGLRELTNTKGEYGYFMDKKSDTTIKSIFNYKNEQGYDTYAFHPFTGRMFSRSIWWKNLGPKALYFRDNYVKDYPDDQKNIVNETHFPAIKDEAFFDYLNDLTKNSSKKYAYYLTVNSHLPYQQNPIDHNIDSGLDLNKLKLSGEAKYQLIHIKNFIIYVARNIAINKWDKVVIVGDHTPPFYTKQERSFYKEGVVPYMVIQKQKK
jgi:hypothetical protein